ncbi:MAG TPA: DUF2497 domain-containing protein [Stellaceae bacterium]|nr:DUF2497 domain-containing protein [Stellaceae bacterium]
MDEILASIRRILAEDAGASVSPRPPAAADVLNLTEAIGADGTVRHIDAAAMRVGPATRVPPLPDGRVEPAVSRPAGSDTPRLVSDAASDAVAASFARLASASRETRREGERDLDALVQEMLRPMLQAWLDEHLPELVERLVQAEIARVVGDATPR